MKTFKIKTKRYYNICIEREEETEFSIGDMAITEYKEEVQIVNYIPDSGFLVTRNTWQDVKEYGTDGAKVNYSSVYFVRSLWKTDGKTLIGTFGGRSDFNRDGSVTKVNKYYNPAYILTLNEAIERGLVKAADGNN